MNRLKSDVKQYIIDQLDNGIGLDNYSEDLHHYVLNEDYFIIGTYKAEQWLGADIWEAIKLVQDYEEINFGKVSTDISNPEALANMVAYILGEELLHDCKWLDDCRENSELIRQIDLNMIKHQLAA
tara:strand:+ start:890 stop:1267 length:378 start_codon:yes stop_codon:yes gene_type:complete